MASPVIADPFHRMKYMERHGSGLRKIVRETEKPPGYTAAYNPKIFSTATDFRVILKNVNYQLSQKNLVNDQVSEQDKSPDIPHTVLNLCMQLRKPKIRPPVMMAGISGAKISASTLITLCRAF